MEAKSLGPPAPSPTIDPQLRQQQQQSEEDRIAAVRDRLSREARDTLIRFGRQKALAGTGDLGGLGGDMFSRDFIGRL